MDGAFNVGTWNGNKTALLNQRMCCVRANDSRYARYLQFSLGAPLRAINEVTNSTTVKHLSSWQVERIQIALPPLKDCIDIVVSIEQQTASLNELQSGVTREIALIQEFRTRLISDVVTGKLDVRALSATLPETVELESIEGPTDDDDLDQVTDECAAEEEVA